MNYHYLLSPINGPLEGLGKISVFIGTKEIFVADTRKLKALMESKGVTINYQEYKGMIHAWMLLNFPESREVKNEIVKLINSDAAVLTITIRPVLNDPFMKLKCYWEAF